MMGNTPKTRPRHQREWFTFADWSRAIRGVPLKSHQMGASLKSFESGTRHQVVLTRHKRFGTGTAALGQVEEAGTIREGKRALSAKLGSQKVSHRPEQYQRVPSKESDGTPVIRIVVFWACRLMLGINIEPLVQS